MTLLSRATRGWVDPEAVFAALGTSGPAAVWSDPVSSRSFIGFAAAEEDVVVDGTPDVVAATLRERLAERQDSALLGWWGVLAYELGVVSEGLAPVGDGPGALLAFVSRGIVLDRERREVTLVALAAPGAEAWLEATERAIAGLRPGPTPPLPTAAPLPAATPPPAPHWRWRHDRAEYLERIERCLAAIERGDAYQLCLTNTITVEPDGPLDPLAVYSRLRALTPTAHRGVLRVHDRWLLSASPEQFLTVDPEGVARTRPMKGTRPRSPDPVTDRALAEELVASEKERAENLMIVDLMRNDLSRVSRVGSVQVPELFAVESFGFSHQLVSMVEGVLETDAVDAVLALFPAGSMTGAPKRSAMRILAELEEGPRGLYSGVWGRLSLDGSVDLAVVIRSIEIGPHGVRVGSGGGITALSDPAEEWDEVVLKARPMLLALGADPAAQA